VVTLVIQGFKLHAAVNQEDLPLKALVTPRNRYDSPFFPQLIQGLKPERVVADAGYDSKENREAVKKAGTTGRQSGELAAQIDINHRDISRRIQRINKRMEQEIGENIIQKQGHNWKLISRLRQDFAAAR